MMCSEQKRNLLRWLAVTVIFALAAMQKCPPARGWYATGHSSNSLQFVSFKEAGGKHKGETVYFDRVANISTAGGTLTETSTIPRHNIVFSQGTLTLNPMSQRKAA